MDACRNRNNKNTRGTGAHPPTHTHTHSLTARAPVAAHTAGQMANVPQRTPHIEKHPQPPPHTLAAALYHISSHPTPPYYCYSHFSGSPLTSSSSPPPNHHHTVIPDLFPTLIFPPFPMDQHPTSIFDDLSPPISLLDSRTVAPDFIGLSDPIPEWDRALLHPLPPPFPPNHHFQHQNPVGLPPNFAVLDLSHPPRSPPRNDDENSVDDTSPPHPPVSTASNQPLASSPPTSQLHHQQSSQEVRGNVSHTRRCRAKVNTNFERLLSALPPPPTGVEVKHKAQILAYAIERFRTVRCQNMKLEMQLALSSPYQMQRWVRSVVASASNLTDALKPFMALICLTKKWKYAELWMPYTSNGTNPHRTSTALKYIIGALPPTVEGEELKRLRTYRSNSRKYIFRPRSGVPGRVYLTMRPEWLPLLNDPVAFPRAPHAVRNKVEVTFAVPVIINGSVQMVVEFYDTARRDYDPEVLNMANEIAVMFGKAFTNSAAASSP